MLVLWILLVLLCIYIINLAGCALYCDRQRKKQMNQLTDVGQDNGSVDGSKTHSGHGRLLGDVIRVNLLLAANVPSHHIRMFLYRSVFKMNIADKVVIHYGAEIRAPWKITIGEGTIIGDKAILDGRSGIVIGKNVNFSTGVWLWTLQHDVNDPTFSTVGQDLPIIIEDRAWISCRTVVLPGVKIGEGSVIAAGGVVTKSTEPYSINGGVPCKKIGERNNSLKYVFDGSHAHFI